MRQQKLGLYIHGILSAIVVTSIFVNPATGKQGKILAQQVNCNNPRSDAEDRECIYRAYQAADRRLNLVYRQLSNLLSNDERQELIKAQQVWIRFRDANCSFEVYRNRGGSGYNGFLNNCLQRMTKERTADFERYIKQRQ